MQATQQLLSVQGPKIGPGGFDLAEFKAVLDSTPAAQQALSAVGLSSTEYTLFVGAAMQAMMVGQMEQRGVKGTLPPGVAKRPPQANIDFMNQNRDLFLRALPGAAAAKPRADTTLPVPNDASSVQHLGETR